MDAELLITIGCALAGVAAFACGFMIGFMHGESRANTEQLADSLERISRRHTEALPLPAERARPGRRTRQQPHIDPDPTQEIHMGKHSRDNAPGTDAQKQREQQAREAEELRKLEQRLRKQGKIK